LGTFRVTVTRGPIEALVTMTCMAARAFIYSVVRCPECNRRLMDVPGEPHIETRIVDGDHASGRGRVIRCEKCARDIEVIEHT